MINLVLPSAMLSVLVVLLYLLPPDSGEKISMGVSLLLSTSVFTVIISENVPNTSRQVPLIGKYFRKRASMCVFHLTTFHKQPPGLFKSHITMGLYLSFAHTHFVPRPDKISGSNMQLDKSKLSQTSLQVFTCSSSWQCPVCLLLWLSWFWVCITRKAWAHLQIGLQHWHMSTWNPYCLARGAARQML